VIPLIQALSTWKGRQYVQRAIEARGFRMPSAYQKFVKDYCGTDLTSDIETYWNEWAKEVVCAGGRANPNLREFRGEYTFRSEYLDRLASTFDYNASIVKNPPIHPCLYAMMKQIRISHLGLEITNRMEKEKIPEIKSLNISAKGWTGFKKDVARLFERYILACGFIKKNQIFYQRINSGLIFQGWVDTGGKQNVVDLPFHFFISHESDPDLVFEVLFNNLIPGFHYYRLYKTGDPPPDFIPHEYPESAVLGIRAHAEMFDVLLHSFG